MMQKNILKSLILLIFSICTFFAMTSSSSAFNAVEESKAISNNPELIYTIYLGMPRSEVEQNLNAVKGWKKDNRHSTYALTRQYSGWAQIKAGASLEQRVVVVFGKNNDVISVSPSFTTDKLDLANNIYCSMYQNLSNKYGNPRKTFSSGNMANSAKWTINNHVYEVAEIIKPNSIYVYLIVRGLQNSDLM